MIISELEKLIQNRMKHDIKRISIGCDELQKLIDVAMAAKESLDTYELDVLYKATSKLTFDKPEKEKYPAGDGPREWK